MDPDEPNDDSADGAYDPWQAREWRLLHDRITGLLNHYGVKDAFRKGDYWLLDDNWGWEVQQLEFQNLALLTPEIVRELQAELTGYPRWSITIRVDVVGKDNDWPGMGIIIHPREIIDELQRAFLPPEFADRVFASNPTSRLKMLVYDARSGVERMLTWRDAHSDREAATFFEGLSDVAEIKSDDPNRLREYCLMTREDVAAFDRFLEGMAGRY